MKNNTAEIYDISTEDEIIVSPINAREEKAKANDVAALCAKGENLEIKTQDNYEFAATVLKEVKSRYKELEAQRKEVTSPLDNAKKKVMDLFRPPLEALEKAEKKIKDLMRDYTIEQERLAKAEQLRLQKLAEKEAEHQRQLLAAKIERATASGKIEKVEELQQQIENVAPIIVPVVAPTISTPKGVSYRDQWSAEVVDFKLLPDEYKLPDMQKLNKVAQATKGTIIIPGIKFNSEKIVASR